MHISVKRMLRTRGVVVAGVTALAVGLALLAGRALVLLIAGDPFASFGFMVLTGIAPFTVGYFLGLWVVAPVTEQLGIGHVITRAVLATGIGATLWFVALGLTGVALWLGSFHILDPSAVLGEISAQLGYALKEALTALVILLPLGVLGGVLLWLWRTANPADHHIEGLIDV